MDSRQFLDGMLFFVTALLLAGVSSFVGHVDILGGSTSLAQGFFDGLSVVACGAAIVMMVRSRRQA